LFSDLFFTRLFRLKLFTIGSPHQFLTIILFFQIVGDSYVREGQLIENATKKANAILSQKLDV